MLTIAAPAVASADPDAPESTPTTDSTTSDTAADEAAVDEPDATSSEASSVTISSADATGSPTDAETEPTGTAATSTPADPHASEVRDTANPEATAREIAESDSQLFPTGSLPNSSPTSIPVIDSDTNPYGRHAQQGAPTGPAPESEAPTSSTTPVSDLDAPQPAAIVDAVVWTDTEREALESISGKDAEIGSTEPATTISADDLPSAVETGLVITATGAAGAAVRRSLTAETASETNTFATTTTADGDPDNRWLDPADSDWNAGTPQPANPPAGASYSVTDAGNVVIYNDSDVDIAVISPYYGVWSEQGLTVIRPGESYTIDETSTNPLGFNAYWVQTERQDGAPVVVAQVMTIGDQVIVAPSNVGSGYPESDAYLPVRGTTAVDPSGVDPDDRFATPDEIAGGGASFVPGDPESAGVSYSVVDDDHIAIYNDGTGDIAVTQGTLGGQLIAFDVLRPGESKVYEKVPGNSTIVSVQGERDANGNPVALGSVNTISGAPVGYAGGDGYPALPVKGVPLPENHAPTGETTAVPRESGQRDVVYVVDGFDYDGDALTYTVHTPPTRGTVVNNGDGTFTYTPTDPDDLHEGRVDDGFLIEISDGNGGVGYTYADVNYYFQDARVNAAPEVVATTGGQAADGNGEGGWTVIVADTDGDSITGGTVSNPPAHGDVTVTRVYESEPGVGGAYVPIPGQYVVTYTPDLERAHEGAYDDEFTVTFNDGHGGTASQTFNVHVPAYNQNPDGGGEGTGENPLDPEEPGTGPGTGTGGEPGTGTNPNPPTGGGQANPDNGNEIRSGSQIGIITVDPEYVIDVDLTDPDGDVVTIASVTTSNGGTAVVRGDQIVYTPRATDGYYYDDVTFVVDDGRGGQTTTVERIFVANTAALPWVPEDQGVVLMISALRGGSDEERLTRAAFDNRTDASYLAFVAMLGKYQLGQKVAAYPDLLDLYLTVKEGGGSTGGYTEEQIQQLVERSGLSNDQVRMLIDWQANGIDVLSVLLGLDSAQSLLRQISAYREVADLAQKRGIDSFIAPTLRQIADSNPLIRTQVFAGRQVTDRLWRTTAELRYGASDVGKFAVKRLGAVGTVVGTALVIDEFARAETPRDYAHAAVEGLATAAPVIGLVGCVVGPFGCVVGYSVGTAVGFGLSGGNAIARLWWSD